MAKLIRFSIFFKSGAKPGTNAPGDPQIFSTRGAVGQDGGVTPPGPEKHGTFPAPSSNSQRKVMYWLGIQSNVPQPPHALNWSPRFSLKHASPYATVAH